MAKWIYKKYNSDPIFKYKLIGGNKKYNYNIVKCRTSYEITQDGTFILTGDEVSISTKGTKTGYQVNEDGTVLTEYGPNENGYIQYIEYITEKYVDGYKQGSFIEEISAKEGTLPNNGRHTDGYWYVKDRIAISSQIKIDGVVRDIVGYELKGYGAVSLQFKDDKGIIHDI